MSDDNSNQRGGRTLGGGPAEPLPEEWAHGELGSARMGRIGGWGSSSGQPHSSNSDSDEEGMDDSDGLGDKRESWFAGGERSGLSVENPDRSRSFPGGNPVRELLRRAVEEGHAPSPSVTPQHTVAFSGGGHRLGSDEVESTYVPDPHAHELEGQTITRHITLWQDGFTIEDGELMRYDDPANSQILNEINSGHAPPSILNVPFGQPVDLRITKHLDQKYVPAKRNIAFQGTGHRLGAPVPFTSSSSGSETPMPGSFPSTSGSSGSSGADKEMTGTKFEVDQTLPTTSVQIRLADGTRMVCRMNLTHTVQDIRNFINASRPENTTRPYTISTTFPNRILDDNQATIEKAGLVNSVVVQRWA